MKKPLLILAVALLLVSSASARVRAVRHPGPQCSLSIAPAWGSAPIAAAGQTRGVVFVYGQTPECAQWSAYSSADWVLVEAAPFDAQPAAYVTVAPNGTTAARTATLIIAGLRLEITQEAAPQVADPNLVRNGSFHTDISEWTWYDRFPNAAGTASWSTLDAGGNPASGSILLRDEGWKVAFQRLQCIPLNGSTNYRMGAKVRTGAPKARGDALFAVYFYESADCTGEYSSDNYLNKIVTPAEPGVWQEYSTTKRTSSKTRSAVLVIASGDTLAPFETWFDDVYVRPE